MYYFNTKGKRGEKFSTFYSQKQISQLYCFTAFYAEGQYRGDSQEILVKHINFQSFEWIE
jgi:hypothetical protein